MEVMKIINPGRAGTQGSTYIELRSLVSIKPHSASGTETPRPRKLSPAAAMMLIPTSVVA